MPEYRVSRVVGDRYAGETFRVDFRAHGVEYDVSEKTASQLYEALEPRVNGHLVSLPDVPLLEQQLLGLVWRGGKIDHPGGEHDDLANAVAGVIDLVLRSTAFDWKSIASLRARSMITVDERMVRDACEREWPDDFAMRNYCEEKQLKALEQLRRQR